MVYSSVLTCRGAERRQLGQDGDGVRHQAFAPFGQPLRPERRVARRLLHSRVQLRHVADHEEDQQLHGRVHQGLAGDQLPSVSAFPEDRLAVFFPVVLFAWAK